MGSRMAANERAGRVGQRQCRLRRSRGRHAQSSRPLAWIGLLGTTTLTPDACKKYASGLWLWYSPPCPTAEQAVRARASAVAPRNEQDRYARLRKVREPQLNMPPDRKRYFALRVRGRRSARARGTQCGRSRTLCRERRSVSCLVTRGELYSLVHNLVKGGELRRGGKIRTRLGSRGRTGLRGLTM